MSTVGLDCSNDAQNHCCPSDSKTDNDEPSIASKPLHDSAVMTKLSEQTEEMRQSLETLSDVECSDRVTSELDEPTISSLKAC